MFGLYNTLTRRVEEFQPLQPPKVGMYSCGPTVYDYAHIGHFRTYVNTDVLRRTLEFNGYEVKHVMNITDVGHLTSDADTGEDKMELGARREGKTAWEISEFYTRDFFVAMEKLNVQRPHIVCKATDYIPQMINVIQILKRKGFVYQIDDGLYFDTSKFPGYGKLAHLDIEGLKAGARVEVNPQKKHPADFALWKFSPKGVKRQMEWESPWGIGFPGWHIECSTMSTTHLGESFDIHTGGVDHIPVHHTNEIAQSEAATGKLFVRYWFHNEFLLVEGQKMSKSLKNIFNMADIEERGFDPMAARYLFLTTHYRQKMNFTWVNLEAAQKTLSNLREHVTSWGQPEGNCPQVEEEFLNALNDDLNVPNAIGIIWRLVRADYPKSAKAGTVLKFDRVLGLNLTEPKAREIAVGEDALQLLAEREKLRKERRWAEADQVRNRLLEMGYIVEDTPEGARVKKKSMMG